MAFDELLEKARRQGDGENGYDPCKLAPFKAQREADEKPRENACGGVAVF